MRDESRARARAPHHSCDFWVQKNQEELCLLVDFVERLVLNCPQSSGRRYLESWAKIHFHLQTTILSHLHHRTLKFDINFPNFHSLAN